MVTIEPHITVNAVDETYPAPYGVAGRIAAIGALPSATFKIGIFSRAVDAKNAILSGTEYKDPSDTSVASASKINVPATYKAYYALEYLFAKNESSDGPQSVLIVNTNYGKSSLVQSSSNTDIAAACAILAEENFDILNILEPVPVATEDTSGETPATILNPILGTIKSFADTQYSNQKPLILISGFDLTGASTVLDLFMNLFNDSKGGMGKAVTTPIKFNGAASSLSIEQSGAWHAAYTAGRAVNLSETHKIYPGIIGENSKDVYPVDVVDVIPYTTLISKGFHTTSFRDRRNQTVQCINNITPKQYDMKIERVRNYMIRRCTFEDYLGDDNSLITIDGLAGLCEAEKQDAIKAGLISDMTYTITSVSTEKVLVEMTLFIPDVIRVIEVNVAVQVTAYTANEEGEE